MKKEKPETICYTVEREFLADITMEELIERMIRSHMKKDLVEEEKC